MKSSRALVAVFLACAFFAASVSATQIKVLSWNIKRGIGTKAPNSAEHPFLAKIINYLNPDVWLIQELGGENAGYSQTNEKNALKAFVVANITIYGTSPVEGVDYFVYASSHSDGYTSTGIVSRYPFLSVTDVSLGSPGRGLVVAKVNVPGTNGVGFFTAHFDSGGTSTDAQNRQGNAELTRDNVNSWAATNSQSAYVLTGDFNENEDADITPVYTIGAVLPNGHIYRPISTVLMTGMSDQVPLDGLGGKKTWSTTSLTKRFDYLMTSPSGGSRDPISIVNKQIFNTKRFPTGGMPPGFINTDSQNASDHTCLFSTVNVTEVPVTATVQGNILLQSYLGGAGIGSSMEFRSPGTQNLIFSAPITLNANGNYQATNVPVGSYDVAVKFPNWLRTVAGNITVGAPITTLSLQLTNGDSDGDNDVDVFDLNYLFGAFGTFGPAGDIDWSGVVDVFDINIEFANFGLIGSP